MSAETLIPSPTGERGRPTEIADDSNQPVASKRGLEAADAVVTWIPPVIRIAARPIVDWAKAKFTRCGAMDFSGVENRNIHNLPPNEQMRLRAFHDDAVSASQRQFVNDLQ